MFARPTCTTRALGAARIADRTARRRGSLVGALAGVLVLAGLPVLASAEETPTDPPAATPAESPTEEDSAPAEPAESESPDSQFPSLRWRTVDADGQAVEGVVVEVTGPGKSSSTVTIEDNTGDPAYAGADLDPEPGQFLVKQLTSDSSTHDVAAGESYQVRPVVADGYLVGDDAVSNDLASATSAEDPVGELVLETDAPTASYRLGPEDISAPYVSWSVRLGSTAGTLVGGAAFELAGPRSSGGGGGNWGTTVTVADCVAASTAACTGPDLDPDAGEFQVKQIGSHEISSSRRYQVRQLNPPNGYSFTQTPSDWVSIPGQGESPSGGAWSSGTYSFGTFLVQTRTRKSPTADAGLICPAQDAFYSISSSGQLRRVSGNPSVITTVGSPAGSGDDEFNGLALGLNGTTALIYRRTYPNDNRMVTIWFYSAANGWQSTNDSYISTAVSSFVTGAVDLVSGDYYFGGFGGGSFHLYKYIPATGEFFEVGWIDTSGAGGGNGDMAFDGLGNLYLVGSETVTTIYTVTAATLASASGGELAASESASGTLTGLSQVNGMTFNTTGSVLLGNGSNVREYNSTTWTEIRNVTNSLNSSTDLGMCNPPISLTVKKDVVGRTHPDDQFRLSVHSGSVEAGTATTNGSATGIQADQIGPLPVMAGGTYRITESMASGSVGTLDDYSRSLTCETTQGSPVTVSPSGDVTLPTQLGSAVECVITNTPLTTTIEVSKTSISATGVTTTGAANWTFGASSSGSGTLLGTSSQTTTAPVPEVGWKLRFPTSASTGGQVTITETPKPGWALTNVTCTAADGTSVTSEVANNRVILGGLSPSSGLTSCIFTNREQLQDLRVTKTAVTAYDVDYTWDITKDVLIDSPVKVPGTGSTTTIPYSVVVTPSAPIHSGFRVTGTVTLSNPNAVAISGVVVADSLAITGASCTVTNGIGVSVPAASGGTNGSVTRTYSCTLPDTTSVEAIGVNTATATWPTSTYPGTSGQAYGTAAANFASASVTTTNDTVTLSDTLYDVPDEDTTLNAADGQQTFDYNLDLAIEPGGCLTYDNTATITNDDDIDESADASVEICAPKGTVTWSKVDDQTPADLLGGSVWTITGPGHPAPGTDIADCVAATCSGLDQDPVAGQFELEGLAWGEYSVTEKTPPAGYSGTGSFTFAVTADNAGTVIDKGPFVNEPLLGTVTWTKIDASDDSLLGGSVWTITGPGHTGTTITDCVAASCTGLDQDPDPGEFSVTDLAWGDYTITETEAPEGYQLGSPAASFSFTIEADELSHTETTAFENTRTPGTVTWAKIDPEGSLLADSQWQILGPGPTDELDVVDCVDEPCAPASVDQDPDAGEFLVSGLAWGDYELIETRAPAGYYPYSGPALEFTIGIGDDATLEVDLGEIENTPIVGPNLPLTGGIGRDAFSIGGLAILMIGMGAALATQLRNRRRKEVT